MKFKFNDIANAISVISGVSLAGIIGVGSYVYLNKDVIIENIKSQAIEAVTGSIGVPDLGGDLPIGTPDLDAPDNAAIAPVPSGGLGVPTF